MAERILKWLAFSIGLILLPIFLSLSIRMVFNLDINLSDYTSEFLFMGVTLATTSLGDIYSLTQKGVKGIHITVLFIVIMFISLVCIFTYGIQKMGVDLSISYDQKMINGLTIVGCISSVITGLLCQVFLEKIEGGHS